MYSYYSNRKKYYNCGVPLLNFQNRPGKWSMKGKNSYLGLEAGRRSQVLIAIRQELRFAVS